MHDPKTLEPAGGDYVTYLDKLLSGKSTLGKPSGAKSSRQRLRSWVPLWGRWSPSRAFYRWSREFWCRNSNKPVFRSV